MAILPYHSEFLICWQRATILLDVLLIAWLWTKTLANNDSSTTWWKLGGRGCYHLIVFVPYLLWWRIATTFRTGEINTPATLMANVKTSWHDALNALALALGLFLALFLSLAVATLPDSWQELQLTAKANSKPLDPSTLPFWLQIVDGDSSFFSDKFTPTRVAFWPTAWLHEQHAHIYPIADTAEQEKYNTLRAKGAKPCESLDNSPKDERTATNDIEEKPVQDSCLMVQPWLPRNLILREKVLTATIDPNLKPELEAKLHWKAPDNRFWSSSLSDTRSASLNHQATLADALAQVVGLSLQNRNFDYADFTELSLPKVDLRYASLKHATLTYTQLEQAHLESAHLADADMTGATLTGAILVGIDTHMPSEQALKKITADYEQQIASIPDYQTNPSSLATKINNFKRRLSQPAVFSGVKEIKPCLRSDKNTEKALHDCTAIGQLNTQTQTDLVAVWRKLACDDETEKHWLAQSMLNRAQDYPWFAQALLDAAKDPNTCVGLANLTAENKVFLQKQVVMYESRKPATP